MWSKRCASTISEITTQPREGVYLPVSTKRLDRTGRRNGCVPIRTAEQLNSRRMILRAVLLGGALTLSGYLLSTLWWRLWMYYGFIGPPPLFGKCRVAHGEGYYDLVFTEMAALVCLAFLLAGMDGVWKGECSECETAADESSTRLIHS
jgi:hypothetical protein